MKRHMEQFEARQLMSIAATAAAGVLYVYGDNDGNGISVEKSGSDLVVKKYVDGQGYTQFYKTKANNVSEIRMYGRGGPDTLTVSKNVTATAYISGEGGADYLQGGGGTNYLYGQSQSGASDDKAADTLVSGFGSTNAYGQKGNDTFVTQKDDQANTSGEDLLSGSDGNDSFYLYGTRKVYVLGDAGDDTLVSKQPGTSGQKTTTFMGGFGKDTIDMSNFTKPVHVYLGTTGYGASGFDEGKRWINVLSDVDVAIGGPADDILTGNDYGNTLIGNGGNDWLFAGKGSDHLYGNAGYDHIDASWGDDFIVGGSSGDWIDGHDGNDTIYGGLGNDNLEGGSGNDKIYGEAGNDNIDGEKGWDFLVGGTGEDEIRSSDGKNFNDVVFGGNEDGTGTAGHDKAITDGDKWGGVFDMVFGVDEIN